MWVRPGPDKTPVPRVSFATRVGDLGCGVGYTNKPFQIHEILWGAEVRRPCRVMFLIYTEVQVPLLQGTMEYDGASVLSLVLLGEPYGTPIRRPRCSAVRALAVRHRIPRHPRCTACGLI